jgi:hypothetical protein
LSGFFDDTPRQTIQLERRNLMVLDLPFLIAVISLIVGILILLIPRLLNFIVAIYLIVIGILGILNAFTWWEEAQDTI